MTQPTNEAGQMSKSEREVGGFKINNDVPIPGPHSVYGTSRVAAVRALEVGESIFFKGMVIKNAGTVIANAKRYSPEMFSRNYTSRTVEGGVRIWRIS